MALAASGVLELSDGPDAAGLTPSRALTEHWRGWLLLLAVLILLACVLPPLAVLAREHVAVEALQFGLLGYAVPALIVLGMPVATRSRLAGAPIGTRARARRETVPGPGQRQPLRRPRTIVVLVAFVATALIWRTPDAVNALHNQPWLITLEAASLVILGVSLWIELTDNSDATAPVSGPMRIAVAALAMWSIWIAAYLLGLSNTDWYRSFHHSAGGLSVAADQEIACGILWFIPAVVFVPVVFRWMASWLRKEGATA